MAVDQWLWWIDHPDHTHRTLIKAAIPLILATSLFYRPVNLLEAPVLAAALILFLGVPHGAFDIEIIRHRSQSSGGFMLGPLLTVYVGLATLVLIAWQLAPGLCLTAFLLISAYHFSGDWPTLKSPIRRLVLGGALLSSTAVFYRKEDELIFAMLASPEAAEMLARWLQAVALPLIAAAGFLSLQPSTRSSSDSAEILLLISAALILPPITFFVLYFCAVHSVRHTLAARHELRHVPIGDFIASALPYAAVAIAGTLIGAGVMISGHVGTEILSIVFVALAALTAPHMLLLEHFPTEVAPGSAKKMRQNIDLERCSDSVRMERALDHE
jgi:beta-carotene 15,15'-dioxygenase